jgi:hypothetical protein
LDAGFLFGGKMPAVRETQIFNGRKYYRYPESKRRTPRVYFYNGKNYLHRDVWESIHGKIPEGHHIHHMDENPLNNEIENLECVSAHDHMSRKHTKTAEWHASEKFKAMWAETRKKAAMFHANLRENPVEKTCQGCGKKYTTVNFKISKYCSNKCVVAAYKKRKKS